jgi:UDP-N-acetylmuramyl pentapeptide phosphotransferase/UDP-N-acetylglucosamine-1-phosphate transferase
VNLLTAITELISVFLFTTLFIFVARKAAKKIGLVDKPNYRKRHQGLIPLVGGISVYAGICFTFAIADYYIPHATLYLACAGVLVLVGALDDRFDISVKIRAVIQAAIAVIMMTAGNLHLSSLGYIFGSWELVLGPFGFSSRFSPFGRQSTPSIWWMALTGCSAGFRPSPSRQPASSYGLMASTAWRCGVLR